METLDGPPDTSKRPYGYVPGNQLFNLVPRDISVESRSSVDFGPSSVLDGNSPMCFLINPTPHRVYTDMKNIELHVKCRITKANGDKLEATDLVAPTNYIGASMISSAELNINGVLVESVTLYPFKAFIETILYSDERAMKGHLTQGLFYKEIAGQLDISAPTGDVETALPGSRHNVALSERYQMTKESKEIQLVSKLHFSLFESSRYLINSCEIEIKLRQSSDSFRLMCGSSEEGYKLQITGAFVRVPMLTISPSVFLGHSAGLKLRAALYSHNRVSIKPWLMRAGTSGDEWDNPFSGRCPSKLVICMVSQTAYNGSYGKNPFLFLPHHMSSITFEVDSKSVPGRPIKTDFERNLYMEAYSTLFAMKNENSAQCPQISRSEYTQGYFFVVYDLQSHIDSKEFVQQRMGGRTRLTIAYAKELQENVQVLLCATYPSVTAIDEARNVYPSLT